VSASPGKYVVIETDTDGTVLVFGPFSWARADMAVDALQELGSVESARALPLLSSSDLTRDLPDWRRTSAKPPVSGWMCACDPH
jgi:hypothetical protein